MRLKPPNLDDRDFEQLVNEAKLIINKECPQWTDLSPGDPGIVILEVFAHLTETMIYRLNRLPEKAYVEFLRLIGVKLSPPTAASATLRFTLSKPQDKPVEIPRGTRVSAARGSGGGLPPVFVVTQTTSIPAGQTQVDAVAYHCDLVEAEDAGIGTGLPGSSVVASKPPIVAATGDDLELIVGVEADASELTGRVRAIEHGGKAYIVWREAEDFSKLEADDFTNLGSGDFTNLLGRRQLVYMVDRMTGIITFAPAARLRNGDGQLDQAPTTLAAVPRAGKQIKLWYCRGGGLGGNVAPETLTTLKDQIPGVTAVTNLDRASGGRDAETLQNALVRGPLELHSLQRAVTASDFELLAKHSSGSRASSGTVARAKAFTKALVWTHAPPGTVEVLLVPFIPEDQRPGGVVTEEALKAHQKAETLVSIRESLEDRRPLGTTCLVNWVRYKKVRVTARAVVHRGEDANAVKARVIQRLHQTINPLPSQLPSPGWSFGTPLRVSNVYDIMLAEPGVSYVDSVHLVVEEVPDKNISSLAADAFQSDTWYATTGAKVFRSMDDGEGWELIHSVPDEEKTIRIRVNTFQAGQVAVLTQLPTGGSRIYGSDDCGETWRKLAETDFGTNDLAWTSRRGLPLLILATDKGLYELRLDASPIPVAVDSSRLTMGFYAVAASKDIRDTFFVAAAAREKNGVFISNQGGESNTFTLIGGKDEDIRLLEVQQDGVRTFLWAASFIAGNEPPKGCLRWELQGAVPPSAVSRFVKNWDGGSCHGLAFTNGFAYAATHEKGVLWLELAKGDGASWHVPVPNCGLPIRGQQNLFFEPVLTVAGDPEQNIVMAGGSQGIFTSDNNGLSYVPGNVSQDRVTLPDTWLFCSGEHQVDVVVEDEAE